MHCAESTPSWPAQTQQAHFTPKHLALRASLGRGRARPLQSQTHARPERASLGAVAHRAPGTAAALVVIRRRLCAAPARGPSWRRVREEPECPRARWQSIAESKCHNSTKSGARLQRRALARPAIPWGWPRMTRACGVCCAHSTHGWGMPHPAPSPNPPAWACGHRRQDALRCYSGTGGVYVRLGCDHVWRGRPEPYLGANRQCWPDIAVRWAGSRGWLYAEDSLWLLTPPSLVLPMSIPWTWAAFLGSVFCNDANDAAVIGVIAKKAPALPCCPCPHLAR